jgi:HEAT repeat protein
MDMPTSGYAPKLPDNEVTRLSREGAFDVHATQASLLGLAKSADPDVRILALQTLALQPTSAAIEAIEAGLGDDSLFVRGESLVLLRSLAMGVGGNAQLGRLVSHPDAEVRGVAVMALVEQSGDDAERYLQQALKDEDAAVRRLATQAWSQHVGRKRK